MADAEWRQRLFSQGGITHSIKAELSNAMGLPAGKRAMFPGGNEMWSASLRAAAKLAPSDPRYVDLRRFGQGDGNGQHYVTRNRLAWQWLGYCLYHDCVSANNGVALSLIGADMEDQQDAEPGAGGVYESGVYEGFGQAIDELGHHCQFFTYGTACLGNISNYTSNRQDNDPLFRFPGALWAEPDVAEAGDCLRACRDAWVQRGGTRAGRG